MSIYRTISAAVKRHKLKFPRAMASASQASKALMPVADRDTMATSPRRMQEILGERAGLYEQIGVAANKGAIADALPLSLLATHQDEAMEWLRLLAEEEHESQICLRRIDAMFPEPPPPAAEPPDPRPAQYFPRIGSLLGGQTRRAIH